MTATGKVYVIKDVGDFAQVPEERLTTCLREFRSWLKFRTAVKEMQDAGLAQVKRGIDEFVWNDDDLGELQLNFAMKVKAE